MCQKWNGASPHRPKSHIVENVRKITGHTNHNQCVRAYSGSPRNKGEIKQCHCCSGRISVMLIFFDKRFILETDLGAIQRIQQLVGKIVPVSKRVRTVETFQQPLKVLNVKSGRQHYLTNRILGWFRGSRQKNIKFQTQI